MKYTIGFIYKFVPGLLLMCFFGMITYAQTTPDPGIPGSYTVIKAEYDLGDMAFKPPSFADSVEVRGSVFYPSTLSTGPFPVLFFLHGRHETCWQTSDSSNTSSSWPCPSGWQPIVSYAGYDYLAYNMASHGYIVISVSCNSINATDNATADYGMNGRGELLQHHMDLWNAWNTTSTGPFGSLFVGALDMQNIGTMGHSRGGEGVVFQALLNQSLGSPYGIKAVLTLAPVDFLRHVLHHIPLLDISPYCDGDVTYLAGVHFYDDSRYSDPTDDAPKHTILFMGANHNFFNTVWTPGSYIAGGADDWYITGTATDPQCGPSAPTSKRFDTTKQKNALTAYMAAFYRVYIGHENAFAPILTVDDIVPPASSTLDSSNVFVSYHPSQINRLDVNRTDSTNKTTINTLQSAVTSSGMATFSVCGGGLAMASCGIAASVNQEPHRGSASTKGLAQMNMQWVNTTNYIINNIPAANENLTQYQDLIFRASVNFHLYSSAPDLDFTVQLIDSAGNISNQVVSNFTHALFHQPGTQANDLPKIVFNTIHLPLSGFTGVDMTTIRQIKFLFDQSPTGAILISDLAFSSPVCSNFRAFYTAGLGAGFNVTFTDYSNHGVGDSLAYFWDFGDPASGSSDTSSLHTVNHIYPGYGTYTACLSVKDFKKNSFVCLDTFCQTLDITPPAVVLTNSNQNISIYPNPANEFIRVDGASTNDMFELYNLYGQVVLNKILDEPIIKLPTSLPAGMYYAIVKTSNGRVIKKIEINR